MSTAFYKSLRTGTNDWYQVGYINGKPTPVSTPYKLNSPFYGPKRWETFIEPLIPFGDCSKKTFVDVGCNAGLTLLEAPSARAAALGEAFSAASDDLSAFSYNPASLFTFENSRGSFLYQEGATEDSR